MRFDKLKGFALGVAVCLVLTTLSTPSFAASVSKQLTAYYNDIKLIINGETVTPKDASGTVVEPFVIDGTTYLPVRAVAEALGQNVSWDGATRTVIIGTNEEYKQPTIWLKNVQQVSGAQYAYDLNDNCGNFYADALYYDCTNYAKTAYALNGQYETFTGTLFLKEDFKNTSNKYRMEVYLDGNLAYVSDEIVKNTRPVEFTVDVSDASLMEIYMPYVWEYGSSLSTGEWKYTNSKNMALAIGNAGLWASK